MKARVSLLVMFGGLASVWAAAAAQTPTEVVVTGKKPEAIEKIDRLSYDLASDPEAQTGIILDILRKLPSVTVTPDGQVQLRGASVTILIDGKVPPDGNAVVKLLASRDVARIEILTNPSAQYAPDGTGGIINLITRKHRKVKLSGDLNVQANTRGQGGMSVSMTANTGPWSLGSQLRLDHWQNRSKAFERQAFANMNGGYDVLDRDDHLHSASEEATGGLSAEYRVSGQSSLSLKGDYGKYDAVTKGLSQYSGSDVYDETSVVTSGSRNGDIQAEYDYRGNHDGETFSLNLDHSDYVNRSVSAYDRGGGNTYAIVSDTGGDSNRLQGDYERRFGRRLLTAGGSIDRSFMRDASRLDSGDAVKSLALTVGDYNYDFSGTRTLTAAYVTWQSPWGDWTVLPGLRVEREQLRFPTASGIDDITWYPSLHVSRYLGEAARLKFSYAKRVTRPSISEYNPNIEYFGFNAAAAGNTTLKPQFTDSYEAAYDYDRGDFGLGATLYYRDTSGSISPYSLVTPRGLLLTTSINAGHSRSGGAELTFHGQFSKRLKYSINSNLYYAETPFIDGDASRTRGTVSGSGNGLLEYTARDGDQIQLNLVGFGRTLTYQGHTSGAWRADINYRRPLSDKLALVVSVTDLFNTFSFRSVVDTEALKTESFNQPNMQAVKVALSYRFGGEE